jgi:hypothetical protein
LQFLGRLTLFKKLVSQSRQANCIITSTQGAQWARNASTTSYFLRYLAFIASIALKKYTQTAMLFSPISSVFKDIATKDAALSCRSVKD